MKPSEDFIKQLRNGELISPTTTKFSLKKWKGYINIFNLDSSESQMIYQCGIFIFSQLNEIRSKIKSLYEYHNISKFEALRLIVGFSNYQRVSLELIASKNPPDLLLINNIKHQKIENDIYINDPTILDIAISCVDGLQRAIEGRLKTNVKNEPSAIANDLILTEINYSNIYKVFENLWHGVMYGFLDFEETTTSYNFLQKNEERTHSLVRSQTRQVRLAENESANLIFCFERLEKYLNKNDYLILKCTGRKKRFLKLKGSEVSQGIKISNALFTLKTSYIEELFPSDLLEIKSYYGFSVKDVISVFYYLAIISSSFIEEVISKLNGKESLPSINIFAPIINKTELANAISNILNISFQKISKIIDFLIFNNGENRDLWCHPLVELKKNRLLILLYPTRFKSLVLEIENYH